MPYREDNNSTFTHAGKLYSINRVLEQVEEDPVIKFPVKELSWILLHVDADSSRVKKADVTKPILIHKLKGKWVVVDGLHRLKKAIELGIDYLPARKVSDKVLNQAHINTKKKMRHRLKAIIIKGNPKYINGSDIANQFYDDLKELVTHFGFLVSFDKGEPYTSPSEEADLWIGHSRGADRLSYAPSHIETIFVDQFQDWQADGPLPEGELPPKEHYEITEELVNEIWKVTFMLNQKEKRN